MNAAWEKRMSELWAAIDEFPPDDFVARVDALTAELAAGSAIGLFERGCARDSTGHPAEAAALYKSALDAGLTGERRRRATIQMASSLRNLGQAADAVALLHAELERTTDDLDGAVRAVLALALVDIGREREAVGVSLMALAAYLPRYNRSMARYAQQLIASGEQAPAAGRHIA